MPRHHNKSPGKVGQFLYDGRQIQLVNFGYLIRDDLEGYGDRVPLTMRIDAESTAVVYSCRKVDIPFGFESPEFFLFL